MDARVALVSKPYFSVEKPADDLKGIPVCYLLFSLVTFHILSLSLILAGTVPWTEEPGRVQSIVSQRARHD